MNKWEPESYWIVNISNRDVGLSDLNLTIRARTSINLLDKKHYHLTLEQIEKSLVSGSLYRKRNKVFKRKKPPELIPGNKIAVSYDSVMPSRSRSIYEIKEEEYEELLTSDEKFAEENADTVTMDQSELTIKKG